MFVSSVHGQWSDWSDWEGCSSTCGQGTQLRHRLCASPEPANGGRDCAGLPVESQPCTVRQCPGTVQNLKKLDRTYTLKLFLADDK